MAPLISHVYELGYMEAIAIPQTECFQGISQFAGFKLIMTILGTLENGSYFGNWVSAWNNYLGTREDRL